MSAFVDEIINQKGDKIPIGIVLSPAFKGWDQKTPSDFIDMSLLIPIELSKIKLAEGSNVKYYTVTLVREDETSVTFEVNK